MSKKDLRIQTRDVRESLKRLLDELKGADLKALERSVPGGEKRSWEEWVGGLRKAERELKEWCSHPDGPDQFTIEVPPKER